MAVTKIGAIKTFLAVAIDYILNPEKTDNGRLVHTFGCTTDGKTAEREFLDIRALGTGKGSVLAQHIKQSFKIGEITPEQALEIGVKTAERLLDNNYQYIVSTHIDKAHIHNHIIFNNIDFVNFRSFEYQKNRGGKVWEKLRNINDDLCRENNLSLIENPKNKGKCYYEWQQDYLGTSWKSKLRYIIDETIMQCTNFDEFLTLIKSKKVECVYTPNNVVKIKFRLEGQERFSRGRTLGWFYDEPQIRKRIEQYQFLKKGISGKTYKTNIIDTNKFQASKGLLHWAELQNMKEASRLINFLTTHNISNQEDIENSSTQKYNERMMLVSQLNKKQRQIDEIGDVIKLINTYEKYKAVHTGLQNSKNPSRYKKENITALHKYDDAVNKLLNLYPDKTLPRIEKLTNERNHLIEDIKELNEQYKQTVSELKELEFARQSIEDYLKVSDKSHKNELE